MMLPDNSAVKLRGTHTSPTKTKLLVIDDQPINIQAIYQIFQNDYDVFMATNGAQALELCQTNPPDLILLDVIMPDMDGLEVCKRLKAQSSTAKIPVIFITGQTESTDETHAFEVGGVDFITKPINPSVVRARVDTQLKLQAQTHLLEQITAQVPGVVYQFRLRPDGHACFPFVSEGIRTIYRLNPEEVQQDATKIIDILHPDDREEFMLSLKKSAETMQIWHHHYRIKFPDGEVRWLFGNATPIEEPDGSYLWHGMMTDVTEELQANEKLNLAASVFANSQEGIIITNPDGLIIDTNPSFSKITGFSREEALGRSPKLLSSGYHDEIFYQELWTTIHKHGSWAGEIWNRNKAGQTYPEYLSISEIKNDSGQVTHYIGIFSDITLLKQREHDAQKAAHKLRESEFRWKFAIEGSGDGLWDWNTVDNTVFFSRRWKEMLGFSKTEINTHFDEWSNRLHPDDRTATLETLRACLNGKLPIFTSEHRLKAKDGNWKWVLSRGMVVNWDKKGQPLRMIGTHTDITDRKLAEFRLLESEQRFRIVADASPAMIWLAGADKGCYWINKTWLDFTGRTLAQEFGNGWAQGVHPNDLERCLEIYVNHFERHEPFQMEYRLKHRDGDYRWILDHGVPRFNANHVFEGYIGSCIDISDRKDIEEALRESESKFSKVFHNSPIAISIVQSSGEIIEVNDTFLDIFGYAREEVIGYQTFELNLWPNIEHREEILKQLKQKGYLHNFEVESQHKTHHTPIILLASLDIIEIAGKSCILGVFVDITERKSAEQQLAAQNLRYQTLLKSSMDGIHIIDWNGNIVDANEAFCRQLGYSLEEGLQLNITQWEAQFSTSEIIQKLRKLIQSNQPSHFETQHRRKDGSVIDVDVYSVQVIVDSKPLLFASARDITERKKIDQALSASEAFAKATIDAVGAHICVIEQTGKILTVNKAWRDFYDSNVDGIEISQIRQFKYNVNCNYLDICDRAVGKFAEEAKQMAKGIRQVINRELEEFVLEYPCHSKTTQCWFNARVTRFSGDSGNLVISHENITERKKSELTMHEAREAALALARSKSEFLANMSHEIRTPMNAIIGLSQLALTKEIAPDIRDYLQKISNSSNSLLSILNDILDFSKLEAGRMTLERKPFNLYTLLDNIQNLFMHRAEEKSLNFAIVPAAEVPRYVIGDEHRLQQILINLVGNAIKFTEQGKVTLEIDSELLANHHARLCFRVTDMGIGMSAADCTKLFQPFSQVDGSINRRFGGTGLGLAISQTLLQLMDSKFSVTSTLGVGSTFSFELLLEITSAADQIPSPQPPETFATTAQKFRTILSGIRVLVAEDNATNQQVVQEFLTLAGIKVSIVLNGKAAVDILNEEAFDAILMDVHMPVMDGFEATRRIRSQARFAQLPIIALTAGVTPEEHEKCLNSGMNDFIAKPINPQQLLMTLGHWLKPESTQAILTPPLIPYTDKHETGKGFNPQRLITQLGNNQERAVQIFLAFKEDMEQVPNRIQMLLTQSNFAAAQELVHKLKGASGNIGADALHEASIALENELKLGFFKLETFNKVQAAFTRTLTIINNLPHPDGSTHFSSDLNFEALHDAINEIQQLLQENEYVSDTILQKLKHNLPTALQAELPQLQKHIHKLAYLEAQEILDKIRQKTA